MKETEKVIEVEDYEIKIGRGGIQLYKGKPVIDVKELPGGRFEMRYCDENEVPLPDSPKIICSPSFLE